MKAFVVLLFCLVFSFANSQSCLDIKKTVVLEYPSTYIYDTDSCTLGDGTRVLYYAAEINDEGYYVIQNEGIVQLTSFTSKSVVKVACSGQHLHVYHQERRDYPVYMKHYEKTNNHFVEVGDHSLGSARSLVYASAIEGGSVAVFNFRSGTNEWTAKIAIFKNDAFTFMTSSYISTNSFLRAQILEKSNGDFVLVQSHYEYSQDGSFYSRQNMYVENLNVAEEKQLLLSFTDAGVRPDQISAILPDDSIVHLYAKEEVAGTYTLHLHHNDKVVLIAQSTEEFGEHRFISNVGNDIFVVYIEIVDSNYVLTLKQFDTNLVEKHLKIVDTAPATYSYFLKGDFTEAIKYIYNVRELPVYEERIVELYDFSCLGDTTSAEKTQKIVQHRLQFIGLTKADVESKKDDIQGDIATSLGVSKSNVTITSITEVTVPLEEDSSSSEPSEPSIDVKANTVTAISVEYKVHVTDAAAATGLGITMQTSTFTDKIGTSVATTTNVDSSTVEVRLSTPPTTTDSAPIDDPSPSPPTTTTTAAPASDDEGLDVGAIVGISAGAVVVVGGVVWLVMRQNANAGYKVLNDPSGRIDL